MSEQGELFPDTLDVFIDTSACVPAFKLDLMNPYFWNKVEEFARRVSGIKVNSAFRSPAWEYSRHRSGMSQHCKGLAVDIGCVNSEQRYLYVKTAIDLDFHRILIYPTFIHLDDKESKSKHKRDIIWMNS